jgi:hypothetical protein
MRPLSRFPLIRKYRFDENPYAHLGEKNRYYDDKDTKAMIETGTPNVAAIDFNTRRIISPIVSFRSWRSEEKSPYRTITEKALLIFRFSSI